MQILPNESSAMSVWANNEHAVKKKHRVAALRCISQVKPRRLSDAYRSAFMGYAWRGGRFKTASFKATDSS